METLELDKKYPNIFAIVCSLDIHTWEAGRVFGDFIEAIENRLGDQESLAGIRRIFDLFIDDPAQDTIAFESLRRIARELGELDAQERARNFLNNSIKYSSSGVDLTFDEWYVAMTDNPEEFELLKRVFSIR